jgi:hypothetical protein
LNGTDVIGFGTSLAGFGEFRIADDQAAGKRTGHKDHKSSENDLPGVHRE